MPSRSAAPWLTTTARPSRPLPCSATAVAVRCSAAATRSATAAPGSPSGGVQVACSSGYRSRISVSLRPSQLPP